METHYKQEPTNHSRGRFELPLNWSPAYLEFLVEHKDQISTVYGSIVGEAGGRVIPHSPQLSAEQRPDVSMLRAHVDTLNRAGIEFNLIMNFSCHGNRLFSDEGKQWLQHQVDLINELNIQWVTVTSYDLARRLSNLAPHVKLVMSVMLNITNIDAFAYTLKQDFNCGGFVIGKGIIKEIPRLRRIVNFLDRKELRAIVIANDFCPTGNCPERMSDHNNACAHYHDNPEDYVSPSIHCREMSMMEPAHFLQAPIVSPFDIPFYESIGVRHFKLTDRVMPDATLMTVSEAYFNRRYDGNIFDLFTYTSYLGDVPKTPRRLSDEQIADIYLGGYAAFKAHRSYFVCQPRADAQDLSGPGKFFEFFAEGKCTMQCGSRASDIPGCYYCEDKAQELLKFPEEWDDVQDNIRRYIAISRVQKQELRLVHR